MSQFNQHEEVCRAMADPAFYPHPVLSLERVDTHISTVFLTGEHVYKLKKPVAFGFLDFTDLESRRYYCEREVSLNERLSRDVYRGVLRICRDKNGAFSLEGDGEVVEYVVWMRQLSEESSLRAILSGLPAAALGESNSEPDLSIAALRKEMVNLGRHLTAFYARGERNAEVDRFGGIETISFNMEENFLQIEPFVNDFVPGEEWAFIRETSRAFLNNWRELFEKRVESGRIHDGHGDLRADHIYLQDGIQIIDCIEFNDRFRYGDVTADLAFLHMDIERLGHPGLSLAMAASYAQHADDPQAFALLDFYAAYRAIVKVKVACLRSTEVESPEAKEELRREAADYLEHAYRYALQFSRPTLWVFCGLPASGKSFFAEKLSQALSLPLFQSDKIRKEGALLPDSVETIVPYGEGIYRKERRNLVYAGMLALAQDQLKSGRSVILDASFSRVKWREEAARLARDVDANIVFVECAACEETIRERLERREESSGISDARLQHLPRMMADFEPLVEASPEKYLRLNTDGEVERLFIELVSEGYARRCSQIREVLSRWD